MLSISGVGLKTNLCNCWEWLTHDAGGYAALELSTSKNAWVFNGGRELSKVPGLKVLTTPTP